MGPRAKRRLALERGLAALAERAPRPAAARRRAIWRGLQRLGVAGLPFPRRHGGEGWALPDVLPVLEACGRHLPFADGPLALGAQMWGVQSPLLRFGTPAQRERLLRPLCEGRGLAVPAASEEGAGSDLLAMRAEAVPVAGGYRLSGRKAHVTAAADASAFLVWARVRGRTGPMGLSCFFVPRGARGTAAGAAPGPASAPPLGWLALRDCPVPAADRVGREGQGLAVFLHAMTMERRLLLAPAVGSMARLLDDAAARARTRTQFGRPIGEYQGVAHRLADMRIRLEASRALLAAAAEGGSDVDDPLASAAKAFVSESWLASCLDAVQIHGARGRLERPDLDAALSAALAARIMSGTNEIQRNLIAARVLAEALPA